MTGGTTAGSSMRWHGERVRSPSSIASFSTDLNTARYACRTVAGASPDAASALTHSCTSRRVISGSGTPANAGSTWLRSSVAYRSAVLGRLVACLVASHRAATVPNVAAARRPGASRGSRPALIAASNAAASSNVANVRPCWTAWLSRH